MEKRGRKQPADNHNDTQDEHVDLHANQKTMINWQIIIMMLRRKKIMNKWTLMRIKNMINNDIYYNDAQQVLLNQEE